MKNLLTGQGRLILMALVAGILLTGCKKPDTSGWERKKSPIMTRWAESVEPGSTWTEYPRPQMRRNNWKNLNGLWDYVITQADSGIPVSWDGKILVPYPVESALSGVMKKITRNERIWYKRTLSIGAKLRNQRVILNFEAVDWETHVYINGKEIGTHRGGYDPFSFDITDYIEPGVRYDLVVSAWDPSDEGYQPIGKQTINPRGIWYTPSSGIWQTVWLEKVSKYHITDYKVVTDIDQSQVDLMVQTNDRRATDDIEVRVFSDSRKLLATGKGKPGEEISLKMDDMRLWSPEDPYLYDLEIRFLHRNTVMDRVRGYFGMRKVSLGKDDRGITRIMLNNRFLFQNGPLDQGFWPDGLYTPPSEEAMAYDLEMLQKMGFNMLRKHVKVEPRRFYYLTDKMGLLVWQDMPSMFYGVAGSSGLQDKLAEARQNFEMELTELVNEHSNHPSIIIWVPFNEGWGQYDAVRIAGYVKTLDPTRLVNHVSGWNDEGAGDIKDIHNYPLPMSPPAEENRAIVLGEFGGLGLMTPGHMWQEENWGYEKMQDVLALLQKYEDFYTEVRKLAMDPGLSAVVYTQTTDVETEANGLMTYDRDRVKMGAQNIANAHKGIISSSVGQNNQNDSLKK